VAIASHTPHQAFGGKARFEQHYAFRSQESSKKGREESGKEDVEESAAIALLRKQDCPL
jgi:hypothetical protein